MYKQTHMHKQTSGRTHGEYLYLRDNVWYRESHPYGAKGKMNRDFDVFALYTSVLFEFLSTNAYLYYKN